MDVVYSLLRSKGGTSLWSYQMVLQALCIEGCERYNGSFLSLFKDGVPYAIATQMFNFLSKLIKQASWLLDIMGKSQRETKVDNGICGYCILFQIENL